MITEQSTLKNGIRLVHQYADSPVAHLGVFILAGSRDETDPEHGLAHFIEHTIFKGTEKRSVLQVLNRLENVGADLDAFTTKEETCINAAFLHRYYSRTLELFSDILLHSVFPEKEIEKEKRVVADEIKSYLDNPADQVFDDFEEQVFKGHPLGRNILGTPRSLKKFNGEMIRSFIRRHYEPCRMIIASVGKIEFGRLSAMVGHYFDEAVLSDTSLSRMPFEGYRAEQHYKRKKVCQVHCITGGPAYPGHHPKRLAMAVLNNLLGGPVMNSRLSLALRERSGLTYHNESSYSAYSDTGIVSIYFGTDPANFGQALDIVYRELRKLRENKLTTSQLHTVRRQVAGQLAISAESNMATMLAMGKSFLLLNHFDSIEETLRKVDNISADDLIGIANEVFDPGRMGLIVYQP